MVTRITILTGFPFRESPEPYTDTAGFTDRVFALCHLLGLYSMEKPSSYATLAPLIGGVVNRKQITGH